MEKRSDTPLPTDSNNINNIRNLRATAIGSAFVVMPVEGIQSSQTVRRMYDENG